MTKLKQSVEIELDPAFAATVAEELALGDFDSLDDLASAAVAEFLAKRTDLSARYDEIRDEISRRMRRPAEECLSIEDGRNRLRQLLAERGFQRS